MIREVHEPQNDNADPSNPPSKRRILNIANIRSRLPKLRFETAADMQLYATLYTPHRG